MQTETHTLTPETPAATEPVITVTEAAAGTALRYVCVVAYAEPGGEEQTFTGTCEGSVGAGAGVTIFSGVVSGDGASGSAAALISSSVIRSTRAPATAR